MTAKATTNGHTKRPAPPSQAAQIAALTRQVAALTTTVGQMETVISGWLEQQAVTLAMSQVESQMRVAVKQKIAERGFGAVLEEMAAPQPPQ